MSNYTKYKVKSRNMFILEINPELLPSFLLNFHLSFQRHINNYISPCHNKFSLVTRQIIWIRFNEDTYIIFDIFNQTLFKISWICTHISKWLSLTSIGLLPDFSHLKIIGALLNDHGDLSDPGDINLMSKLKQIAITP